MNKLIRSDINSIDAYVAGKPIDLIRIDKKTKSKRIVKLNSNENAYGASKLAKKAIRDNLCDIFRYPDGSCYFIKTALSKKLNIKPENLIFGNGSDEIIDIIIKTFLNRNEDVITSQTTFAEYEIITKINGFKILTAPLKNFTYDLERIEKNITKNTKIIFIANPNNPTGTYIPNDKVLSFIKRVGKDKLIVIDEAYLEFVDALDFPRLINYFKKTNLIIMRTFSKAYGLAGLRIGYAIARPEFVEAMERIRQPFNVNFLAQKAAEAALKDNSFIEKTKTIIKEKYKLYNEFEALGIEYIPSQANFIMFKTDCDGLELSKRLSREGVLIRDLKQYKLDKYVRVTIGMPQENRIFIKNLKKLVS